MRILGHPVHVMLIHFPSALFPMEFVCYILLFFTGKQSFADASFYAMAGGVFAGWIAVLFGALDLAKIPPYKPDVIKKALFHGSLNTVILITYTVLVYLLYKKYPQLPVASTSLLITKGMLIVLLIIGNYWGGELILKYKVAIDNN